MDPPSDSRLTFTDSDIAAAVADLYARAARLQAELAPLGITVTVNVSVRIATDG